MENTLKLLDKIYVESDDSGLVEEYLNNFYASDVFLRELGNKINIDFVPQDKFVETDDNIGSNDQKNPILLDQYLVQINERTDKSVSLLTELVKSFDFKHDFHSQLAGFSVHDFSERPQRIKPITVVFWDIFPDNRPEIVLRPDPKTTINQFIGLSFLCLYKKSPDLFSNFDTFNVNEFDVKILLNPMEGPDSDFPPLNASDNIGKYDFNLLALTKSERVDDLEVLVNIYSTRGINHLVCSSTKSLGVILDRIIDKLQLKEYGRDYKYRFKRFDLQSNTFVGDFLDRTVLLCDMINLENLDRIDLALVRTSSRLMVPSEQDQIIYQSEPMYTIDEIHNALQTKRYKVDLMLKNLFGVKVIVEVCERRLKINASKTLMSNKIYKIDYQVLIRDVMSCEIDESSPIQAVSMYEDLMRKSRVDLTFFNPQKNKTKVLSLIMNKMKAMALKEQIDVLLDHNREVKRFL